MSSKEKIIKAHWYRPDPGSPDPGSPCGLKGCGRPQGDHMESVGEWIGRKPHLFLPHPLAVLFCLRCDRRWGHSTHWGSRAHRRIWGIGRRSR